MRTLFSSELTMQHSSYLIQTITRLLSNERNTLADFLICLHQIYESRSHEVEGFSSLFNFLVEGLNISEPSASKRVAAMHLAAKYPLILDYIREGRIHLTGLYMLKDELTEKACQAVLDD